MTTSGTANFNLDLAELIDEAYERCGKMGALSGYDFKTARRSLQLLSLEFANRGLNLFTLDQGTIALVNGVETYDLPLDTVDILESVIRTNPTTTNQLDVPISRISVSTYATIPNKTTKGKPIQMWVERLKQPRVTVWPAPDSDNYELVYWRLRRIQDAGTGGNTQDVPFRFLPALVAGLAYYLSMKTPEGAQRAQALKAQFEEAWALASDEDRDRASVRFVPRVIR